MEVSGLDVDGLLAPLKASRKEPGDSQHAPPKASGHQEEVEEHPQHRTPPVMQGALFQNSLWGQVDGGRGEGIVAGNRVVGSETDEEDDGDYEVGEGQENDRLFRIRKASHVDAECGLKSN